MHVGDSRSEGMMKTCVLSLCGFLAGLLMATRALADDPATDLLTAGTIQVGAGWTLLGESNEEQEDESDDQHYPTVGGAGAISIPLSGGFSAQADLAGEHNFIDADDDDNQTGMIFGGAHLSWRDPEQGLVGVFGGVGRGWTERSHNDTYGSWIGVEGQAYFDAATLYLQAARVSGNVDDTEEDFRPAFLVRAVGRYFVDDNSRIEVETGYANANNAIDDDDDMWAISWGVRYDRRIGDGGWHGFGGYRGTYYDTTTEGEELTEHVFSIGVSYLFGAESMKANDRRGATLDQPSLPMRATNWAEPLD